MKRLCLVCLFAFSLTSVIILFLGVNRFEVTHVFAPATVKYDRPEDFDGFNNVSGTADGCYIIPNIVHFLRFGQPEFTFADTVCVLAAFKNQRPDEIYFHTDVPGFRGKYWELLLSIKGLKDRLALKYLNVPAQVFGQPLSKKWRKFHGGDVARLQILMQYGGIYLDNDSYIVKSLDEFRKFEITLGWKEGGNISNQVVIAHKNARFLKEWLNTYKDHYEPTSWFYNAGIRPTQEVLLKRPELVHRISRRLAEYHGIPRMLYLSRTETWRDHYAIHLLIHHQYLLKKNMSSSATYPVKFDEKNIKNYKTTFRDMVFDVYPFEQ